MRCVIVDDERFFAERIAEYVLDYYVKKGEMANVRCLDAYTLLNLLSEGESFDLYLLDIEMPGIDGLQLAERVHKLDSDAKIVFITSHDEYAVQSYKLRAYYYILKCEYKTELPWVLEQVWDDKYDTLENYYDIETSLTRHQIRFSNIIYLEKQQKYTAFYCRDDVIYRERKTLTDVYEDLPKEQFSMIDRGRVINLAYVKTITRYEVILKSGKILAISRGMSPQVHDDYAQYWSKKV